MSFSQAKTYWRKHKDEVGGAGSRQLLSTWKRLPGRKKDHNRFVLVDKPCDWVKIQNIKGDRIDELVELLATATHHDWLTVRVDVNGKRHSWGGVDEMLGVLFDLHATTLYRIDHIHTWLGSSVSQFNPPSMGGDKDTAFKDIITIFLKEVA